MLKIYRASAGSGKTHRLTGEYMLLLFQYDNEHAYRKILAVTFTNKATDEMKSRILRELYALSVGAASVYRNEIMDKYVLTDQVVKSRARKLLVAMLHDYAAISISTIDKFFQQVIRAFAHEIGVQGGYNLELDTNSTLAEAIDTLFLNLNQPQNKQLLQWLTDFAEERIENSESWNPRNNIEALGDQIFKENYQHKAEETSKKLHDRAFLNSYRTKLRTICKEFETQITALAQKSLDLLEAHGLTTSQFKGGSKSQMNKLYKFIQGDYQLKPTFVAMTERVENCYTKTAPKSDIVAIESVYGAGLQSMLLQLVEKVEHDIVFYNSAQIILKHISTLGILSDLALQIHNIMASQNTMLISDTNGLLNKIIDNSDSPFVYEKMGVNLQHFMIDEFQDTSFLQWKNFRPLISTSLAASNTNMVVGDVKQSIYRWRNSDWKLLDNQLQLDFRSDQYEEISLDTNWRSDQNIVAFNNAFFQMAALLVQHKFNEQMLPILERYPALQTLTESILRAYKHVKQELKPHAATGCVTFSFVSADESEDKWKQLCLKKLPAILEDLQDRGYMPWDVAILVRTNNEASEVLQYMLAYQNSELARTDVSYRIMGNEGLLIATAGSVRFIVALMRLILSNDDIVSRTILNFEYASAVYGYNSSEALTAAVEAELVEGQFSSLFNAAQNKALSELRHASVFEITEQIIGLFNIGNWHGETAFVQGFQDLVFKQASGKYTDLNGFLRWWDQSSDKHNIATPEIPEAFRIMTIHKSKGLDFKAVIMPFCNWEFNKKGNSNKSFLWTSPTQEPFNELPLLPIEFSAKLANSIFAPEYFTELMHQYIDHLNLAYVAFTRSRHEIIGICPAIQTKDDEEGTKLLNLSWLLQLIFTNQLSENILATYYNPTDAVFLMGEPCVQKCDGNNQNHTNKTSLHYDVVSPANRLQLRNKSAGKLAEVLGDVNTARFIGTLMHEVLQQIVVKADAAKILKIMVAQGKISDSDAADLKIMLDDFWQQPETERWFGQDVRVLNEALILTKNAGQYRPDRIVIDNANATIIDYKFGELENQTYVKQVQEYMHLLIEMNYTVKGFVCYMQKNKIMEVFV